MHVQRTAWTRGQKAKCEHKLVKFSVSLYMHKHLSRIKLSMKLMKQWESHMGEQVKWYYISTPLPKSNSQLVWCSCLCESMWDSPQTLTKNVQAEGTHRKNSQCRFSRWHLLPWQMGPSDQSICQERIHIPYTDVSPVLMPHVLLAWVQMPKGMWVWVLLHMEECVGQHGKPFCFSQPSLPRHQISRAKATAAALCCVLQSKR